MTLTPCSRASSAEENTEPDHVGAFADQRLDDGEVRDDEGDKGFSTCPLTAGDGA